MGYINNILYSFNKNRIYRGYNGRCWPYIEKCLTPRQFGENLNERRNNNGKSNNKRKINR